MLTSWLLLVMLGLVVGFFAGLLGIGGGAIMVPALTSYFLWRGFSPDLVVHLALATSMSCIVINALISTRTHQQHQAIRWPITWKMTPTVLLGSAVATVWVIQIEAQTIALVFLLLMVAVAGQLVWGQPGSGGAQLTWGRLLPGGLVIGFLSAMIAIGGGSLSVPFLTHHQINIKQAIATAASIGLPLSLVACMIYLLQTAPEHGTSGHTWGFIHWPATVAITAGSLLTTPMGAHLTHRLPVLTLKRLFAAVILILAIKMYLSVQ
ncbi:sulfite exporter TauE/SafE family protein [Marinicella meishanensis]|uniref:sulfite exporter TauE/SafE family protein n=1 Tax=Marinicella meishanensis TaxID=2873263 RepID=UPI001CBDA0F1|nr:sulfite exporter TauE/SafE family protein [Marinicella sp. NBU2979]